MRRVWVGLTLWNGGTGLAWVTLAAWRLTRYGVAFVPLLATGLLAFLITAMALASRRNHARVVNGVSR
jgi:cellulose synthase (UDP-forming)